MQPKSHITQHDPNANHEGWRRSEERRSCVDRALRRVPDTVSPAPGKACRCTLGSPSVVLRNTGMLAIGSTMASSATVNFSMSAHSLIQGFSAAPDSRKMKKGMDSAPPFFARSRRRYFYFADFLPLSRCCFLSSMSLFADAKFGPDWLIQMPRDRGAPASAMERHRNRPVGFIARLSSTLNRTSAAQIKRRKELRFLRQRNAGGLKKAARSEACLRCPRAFQLLVVGRGSRHLFAAFSLRSWRT